MNADLIKYSIRNLKMRRLRSFLSTLSILIGIMSIYALLSFGQGLGKYIDEIGESMGTDKVIISQRTMGAPGTGTVFFSDDDVEFIRRVKGVREVVAIAFSIVEVDYKDQGVRYVYAIGLNPDKSLIELFSEGFGADIAEGRMLTKGDVAKVVIGHNYGLPNKVFKRPVQLGDKIEINGVKLDVVGIYEEMGNPEDDRNLYMSFDGLELVTGEENNYAQIFAQTEKGEDPDALATKIQEKFRKHRGLAKGREDFYVQTFADLIKTFTDIINGLNAVLFVIALISVVVAAVNIANTMYTAVLERTKEIGILKAIGAKNKSILFIFMFESGFLGLLGGTIGVLFGYAIAKMGGFIAAGAGYALLKPYFPLWLTIGCLLFAFIVGALSGLSPSIQASKQKPVDALRYE